MGALGVEALGDGAGDKGLALLRQPVQKRPLLLDQPVDPRRLLIQKPRNPPLRDEWWAAASSNGDKITGY